MKHLTIIRHAKSSWDRPGLDDHDRPLNARGERDAPKMGQALSQRGPAPGAVVASTALRARRTAGIVCGELGFPDGDIREDSALYLASADQILRVVQGLDESVESALLFGHNPGMHEFSRRLAGEDDRLDRFPTLATARFELDVETWGEADWGDGLLLELITPKILREG